MLKRTIKCIADLIQALNAIRPDDQTPIWYRGHADSRWKLQSAYDRLKSPPKENELLNRFRQNANLLLEQVPAKSFEWLFLMQHYGVPTRLLDWSESPLVALYFVVHDRNAGLMSKAGALWVLFPLDLNRNSTELKAEVYIPSFDDEWLNNYSVEQYSKGKDTGILPLAAIATRNNPRIQAQLGVFTIGHLKRIPIEEIETRSHCVKLIVPASAKLRIGKELQTLGMNRFQVFPELASIGDILTEGLK
jgi:hypothetical protein